MFSEFLQMDSLYLMYFIFVKKHVVVASVSKTRKYIDIVYYRIIIIQNVITNFYPSLIDKFT